MDELNLFDKLKKYLTKEFMELSDEKDEMLYEKVRLEVEKQQDEHQLFNNGDVMDIKKLFSPLDDEIFTDEDNRSHRNDIILHKLQNIEKNLETLDNSMTEIKEFIGFIQSLEKKSEENQKSGTTGFSGNFEISWLDRSEGTDFDTKLYQTVRFLEKQYPETEFLLDFDKEHPEPEEQLSYYIIYVLFSTISVSIETAEIDTVIIEGKTENKQISISLQMLLDDETIDQYSYQYEINLK